jgi:hypothetical protein
MFCTHADPGYVGEWESTGWRGGGGCPTPAPRNPSPMVLLTRAACVNDMRVYRGRNAGPLCLKSGGRGGGVPRVSCMHSVCWRLLLACSGCLCAMRTRSGRAVGVHFAIRVDILCERRRGGDGHALRRVHGPFFMRSVRRWVTSRLQEVAQVLGRLSGHPGSVFRVGGKEEGEAADTHSGMSFFTQSTHRSGNGEIGRGWGICVGISGRRFE